MDSLEEAKLRLLGIEENEEDDDSFIDHLAEAVRYDYATNGKDRRVHGLASKRNITVNTPKIGLEAKALIPAPITEDDDFEKLVKKYDPELRIHAWKLVYSSRRPKEREFDTVGELTVKQLKQQNVRSEFSLREPHAPLHEAKNIRCHR